MDQIKDIIPDVINHIQDKKRDIYIRLQNLWVQINQKNITEHTSIVGLDNGLLLIHVDSPAWLFQLRLQKQKIENQLIQEIPEISGIIFKIGKVK